LYGNVEESMDDKFLTQKAPFILQEVYSMWDFTNLWLILDGHRLHFTLEAIDEGHEFHLYMITIPAHTLHAFQPLDISCFKRFKTTFLKKNVATMVRKKYSELDKIALAKWVDKVLD